MALRQYISLLSVIASLVAGAQTLRVDGDVSHWEANFCAGLNTDGYLFDFGAAYFANRFIGIKANVGCSGEIGNLAEFLSYDDGLFGYDYDYDPDNAVNLKFMPSLVLRSPCLFDWKSQDAGFYLFAEPGMIFSTGTAGSHKARHVNWDLRAGINLQLDRVVLFAGYDVSDFSLYSGTPYDPGNGSLTHSVFIGSSYKF